MIGSVARNRWRSARESICVSICNGVGENMCDGVDGAQQIGEGRPGWVGNAGREIDRDDWPSSETPRMRPPLLDTPALSLSPYAELKASVGPVGDASESGPLRMPQRPCERPTAQDERGTNARPRPLLNFVWIQMPALTCTTVRVCERAPMPGWAVIQGHESFRYFLV
eukprot:5765157-Pleurochrysis_carterae.AAC.4